MTFKNVPHNDLKEIKHPNRKKNRVKINPIENVVSEFEICNLNCSVSKPHTFFFVEKMPKRL